HVQRAGHLRHERLGCMAGMASPFVLAFFRVASGALLHRLRGMAALSQSAASERIGLQKKCTQDRDRSVSVSAANRAATRPASARSLI
ncbi:hypothetical protein SB717_35190, partial [Priestia sp. SIMBA_032]|uniref:hypothetical protein n=1 Tax=Priestia sp. SIMBA_032 TaxID=3085775 RepID=UPI003978B883